MIEAPTMLMQIGAHSREMHFSCEMLEAIRITWPPGARTPKHDHCAGCAFVWVIQGEIFEIREGGKKYHSAGEGGYLLEIPDGKAHIVGNDSEVVAITFHVYVPRLQMREYPDDETDTRLLAQPKTHRPRHQA